MSAGQEQLLALILTSMAVIFIPLLALMVRIVSKWTKVETKLDVLVEDMKGIVADKDKTHSEMLKQMSDDRRATDRRLRWLEETLWKGSRNAL